MAVWQWLPRIAVVLLAILVFLMVVSLFGMSV